MPARAQDSAPLLGLVLLLVGAGSLAGNLGYPPTRLLGALWPWPLLLGVLGVAVLIGRGQNSIARGLILILAGALYWASRDHLLPVPYVHVLAPSVLLIIGGVMIWRAMGRDASE